MAFVHSSAHSYTFLNIDDVITTFIMITDLPWWFQQQYDHNEGDQWQKVDRRRMYIRACLLSIRVVSWKHQYHSRVRELSLLLRGNLAFQALNQRVINKIWVGSMSITFSEFWMHVKISKDIPSLTLKVVELCIINNFRDLLNHYIVKLSNNNGRYY